MSRTCPDPRRRPAARHAGTRRSAGFTTITAVFVLVVLAALGAAMVGITVRQQLGSVAELESARALQSARAGLEWATYQVQRNPAPPGAAPGCFAPTSFSAAGLAGYTVTVACVRTDAVDGSTALAFYRLVANACNAPSGGACPASGTPGPTYVERQLTWTVVR